MTKTTLTFTRKVALILLVIILMALDFAADAATHHIEMQNMKFVPDSLEIKSGDVVIFTNKSNLLHNVVSPKNKIRSKMLKKGDKFEYKFESVGLVEYYCEPHRNHGMKGKVDVK